MGNNNERALLGWSSDVIIGRALAAHVPF
jgi:hypothetical protein